MTTELTQETLRSVLSYDPGSGEFRWGKSTGPRAVAGSIAGSIDTKGRRQIKLFGRSYFAHRLAFLYMTGEWPVAQVDHINRDFTDNRWQNIRQADATQNSTNRVLSHKKYSRSLPRGAYPLPSGRYWSCANANGKKLYLGTFDTAEEAHAAYLRVRREHVDPRFVPSFDVRAWAASRGLPT